MLFNVRPTSATSANIKPSECAVFAGKALTVNTREGQLVLDPHGNTTIVFQHKAHMRELVNYLLIDVAQIYRIYMIWELALDVAMGMKRIYTILPDNCGCGVICHCGMSRGHCCILGTPRPAYFDS